MLCSSAGNQTLPALPADLNNFLKSFKNVFRSWNGPPFLGSERVGPAQFRACLHLHPTFSNSEKSHMAVALPGAARSRCGTAPRSSPSLRDSRPGRAAPAPCRAATYEVRICTNKVCNRQGSRQILQFGRDLALPTVDVVDCGCLGSCGAGPNIAVLPSADDAMPLLLHHITTPAKLAEALEAVCGVAIDDRVLRATQLRLAGNAAALDNDLPRAISMYTEALDLDPPHGRHLLLANRSGAKLSAGDAAGALDDAAAAVEVAPPEFTKAGVRLADALYALGRIAEALDALHAAATRHPPFAKTDEYKGLERAVQRTLAPETKFWT